MKKKLFFCLLSCALLQAQQPVLEPIFDPYASQELTLLQERLEGKINENISDDTFYVDVGSFLLPVPIIGFGWRAQSGHVGLDLSFNTMFLIMPVAFQEKAMFLHFPKPNLASQWYWGLGAAATQSASWMRDIRTAYGNLLFGPSFTFGKSYLTGEEKKRFFQANVDVFFSNRDKFRTVPYPAITLNYGFGF